MERRTFKSVKSLVSANVYRPWKDYEIGDIVVGTYVGTQEDNYGKTNYKLKIEECWFKDGSGEDFKGKTLVLNSCGSLDAAMKEVSTGKMIQVEYTGSVTLSKGKFAGKDAHSMTVDEVELAGDSEDVDL